MSDHTIKRLILATGSNHNPYVWTTRVRILHPWLRPEEWVSHHPETVTPENARELISYGLDKFAKVEVSRRNQELALWSKWPGRNVDMPLEQVKIDFHSALRHWAQPHAYGWDTVWEITKDQRWNFFGLTW